MKAGIIFSIIHILYINTVVLIILFSNNIKTLSYLLLLLILNYFSIIYFKDCPLTILENKNNDLSLVKMTKYSHIYYNNTVQYSSSIACTLAISGIGMVFFKLFLLLFFPTIQSYF